MSLSHTGEIYYLPGMGGRLDRGLGEELIRRGYSLCGRETVGAFKKLSFKDQINAVKQDLIGQFWTPEARVIANSFGAYLFLHAQLELEPFPGRVLLLSPIVSGTSHSETGMRFYPPRADVLRQAANEGNFPTPENVVVHVGENDWQAGPEALKDFCDAAGIEVYLVPDRGHTLGADYVANVLDDWLHNKNKHKRF